MTTEPAQSFPEGVTLRWREPLSDDEMVDLVASHGGKPVPGWWDQIRPHSLGWVTARLRGGTVIGFVNVVSDGGDHAFLIDTKTRGAYAEEGSARAWSSLRHDTRRRLDASGYMSTSTTISPPSTSAHVASNRRTPG